MELFGIKRWSKREALEDLERAGLIRLREERGRLVPELAKSGE
jgi:DNA-binding FadR family transcriptional regulator